MYLLLYTIIYCLVTQIAIANLEPGPTLGIYLITLAFFKGYFSEELKDVFNFRKTKYLFNKVKIKDSSIELLCLILIYINALFMDYEPVSLLDIIILFVGFVTVYRFLFWGTSRTIRERKR